MATPASSVAGTNEMFFNGGLPGTATGTNAGARHVMGFVPGSMAHQQSSVQVGMSTQPPQPIQQAQGPQQPQIQGQGPQIQGPQIQGHPTANHNPQGVASVQGPNINGLTPQQQQQLMLAQQQALIRRALVMNGEHGGSMGSSGPTSSGGATTGPTGAGPISFGDPLRRLSHLQELIARTDARVKDIDYWRRVIVSFFSDEAFYKLVLNGPKGPRRFDIPFDIIPRFYLLFFESGVSQIQICMENLREYPLAGGGYVVDCSRYSINYWYEDGSMLVSSGSMRTMFNAAMKIDWFEQSFVRHQRLLEPQLMTGPNNSMGGSLGPTNTTNTNGHGNGDGTSPHNLNSNMKTSSGGLDHPLYTDGLSFYENFQQSSFGPGLFNHRANGSPDLVRGSMSSHLITTYGITKQVLSFLELSETLSHMRDAISLAVEPNSQQSALACFKVLTDPSTGSMYMKQAAKMQMRLQQLQQQQLYQLQMLQQLRLQQQQQQQQLQNQYQSQNQGPSQGPNQGQSQGPNQVGPNQVQDQLAAHPQANKPGQLQIHNQQALHDYPINVESPVSNSFAHNRPNMSSSPNFITQSGSPVTANGSAPGSVNGSGNGSMTSPRGSTAADRRRRASKASNASDKPTKASKVKK